MVGAAGRPESPLAALAQLRRGIRAGVRRPGAGEPREAPPTALLWAVYTRVSGGTIAPRQRTIVSLGLGLAACQQGLSVGFTAAALVHELIEARDERRLLNLQEKLAWLKLLIVDELGYVPLSNTGQNSSSRSSTNATSAGRSS